MWVGYSIVGSPTTFTSSTVEEKDIPTLTLQGMVIDEIYATSTILVEFDWKFPESWEFDTIIQGDFNNSTYAGNVEFSERIVQRVKIKKRFKGDFDWKTIYEKDIETFEDFYIQFYDYLEPSRKTVEYAYVAAMISPEIGVVDTDIATASVDSEFDSYFMVGQEEAHPMILDVNNTVTFNRASNTIVAAGREYPYVVNNGMAKYYSGTLTATFIELKDGCEWDVDNGYEYRNHIDKFLTDGRAKILKTFEGDMYMINIVGDLPRSSDHYQHVTHEISWVEGGNPTSVGYLFDNGFINTDVDRE